MRGPAVHPAGPRRDPGRGSLPGRRGVHRGLRRGDVLPGRLHRVQGLCADLPRRLGEHRRRRRAGLREPRRGRRGLPGARAQAGRGPELRWEGQQRRLPVPGLDHHGQDRRPRDRGLRRRRAPQLLRRRLRRRRRSGRDRLHGPGSHIPRRRAGDLRREGQRLRRGHRRPGRGHRARHGLRRSDGRLRRRAPGARRLRRRRLGRLRGRGLPGPRCGVGGHRVSLRRPGQRLRWARRLR